MNATYCPYCQRALEGYVGYVHRTQYTNVTQKNNQSSLGPQLYKSDIRDCLHEGSVLNECMLLRVNPWKFSAVHSLTYDMYKRKLCNNKCNVNYVILVQAGDMKK